MPSGIYQIRNLRSGQLYVGSAKNFRTRWGDHRGKLGRERHFNRHLQNAWRKHGAESFVFEVLLVCAPVDLLLYEQLVLDCFRPAYNTRVIAHSNRGAKRSPEAIAKAAASNRGQRRPDETRARISASLMGNRPTPATLLKLTMALRGRKFSARARANIAAASSRRRHTAEAKAKIGAANKGRVYSAAHREASRLRCIGRKHSPETRAKMSASHRRRLAEKSK